MLRRGRVVGRLGRGACFGAAAAASALLPALRSDHNSTAPPAAAHHPTWRFSVRAVAECELFYLPHSSLKSALAVLHDPGHHAPGAPPPTPCSEEQSGAPGGGGGSDVLKQIPRSHEATTGAGGSSSAAAAAEIQQAEQIPQQKIRSSSARAGDQILPTTATFGLGSDELRKEDNGPHQPLSAPRPPATDNETDGRDAGVEEREEPLPRLLRSLQRAVRELFAFVFIVFITICCSGASCFVSQDDAPPPALSSGAGRFGAHPPAA